MSAEVCYYVPMIPAWDGTGSWPGPQGQAQQRACVRGIIFASWFSTEGRQVGVRDQECWVRLGDVFGCIYANGCGCSSHSRWARGTGSLCASH